MDKVCSRCGVRKDSTAFYPHKSKKDGLRSECKACSANENREGHRRRNPFKNKLRSSESAAKRNNREPIHATAEELESAFTGYCWLCGNEETAHFVNADHDHKTGAFRGYLCRMCNTWLGRMGDDPTQAADALGVYHMLSNYGTKNAVAISPEYPLDQEQKL